MKAHAIWNFFKKNYYANLLIFLGNNAKLAPFSPKDPAWGHHCHTLDTIAPKTNPSFPWSVPIKTASSSSAAAATTTKGKSLFLFPLSGGKKEKDLARVFFYSRESGWSVRRHFPFYSFQGNWSLQATTTKLFSFRCLSYFLCCVAFFQVPPSYSTFPSSLHGKGGVVGRKPGGRCNGQTPFIPACTAVPKETKRLFQGCILDACHLAWFWHRT